MRRREFLGAMGAAASAWPIAAASQTAPPRIGVLFAGSEGSLESKASLAEISEGLRDGSLIEGRDYVLEWRFAAGAYVRFPALATELARSNARILHANTIAAARAAQGLSPPIPVVMMGINDPVGNGLIGSLARPGGHTTGLATLAQDLSPKMLEYQQMIVPEAKVLGVIYNPAKPTYPREFHNPCAHDGDDGSSRLVEPAGR